MDKAFKPEGAADQIESKEEAVTIIEGLKKKLRNVGLVFAGIATLGAGLEAYKWNTNKEKDEKILNNLKAMKNIVIDHEYTTAPGGFYTVDEKGEKDFGHSGDTVENKTVNFTQAEVKFNENVDPGIQKIDILIEETRKELEQ